MIGTQRQLLWQDRFSSRPHCARVPVPKVFRFTGLILIAIFIVTASLVAIARSTGTPFNHFAAYGEILPGQLWANTEAYGFECSLYYAGGDSYREVCSLRPATGIFSHISANRSNDAIDTLIFRVRDNALTLGEVTLALSIPPGMQRAGNSWVLDEIRVVVPMAPGQFSYFQTVRAIYLYHLPLPDLGHD